MSLYPTLAEVRPAGPRLVLLRLLLDGPKSSRTLAARTEQRWDRVLQPAMAALIERSQVRRVRGRYQLTRRGRDYLRMWRRLFGTPVRRLPGLVAA